MSLTNDDPWDWPIDIVVAYFCDPQGPLFPRFSNSINRNDLESALRDNQLSGELILEVDDSAARGYLGITALGPLICFRRTLQALRQQSTKWQTYLIQTTNSIQTQPNPLLPSIAETGLPATSPNGQPRIPSIQPTLPIQTPILSTPTAPTARSNEGRRVAPLLISEPVHNRNSSIEGAPKGGSISQAQLNQGTPARLSQLSDGEDHSYDHLLDWEEASNDEVLPLYGDSDGEVDSVATHEDQGSETEEDDDETENEEVEDENGNEAGFASDEEQHSASTPMEIYIRDAEIAQRSVWEAEKLPHLQLQAHKYWTEARDKTIMRDYISNRIVGLRSRLRGLERKLLDTATESDLVRLVEVLQPTVVDIAVAEWKVALFSQDVAPEKPNDNAISKIKKQRQINHEANEEDLTSEDDDDEDEGEDEENNDGEEENEEEEDDDESRDGDDYVDYDDLEPMEIEDDNINTRSPSHSDNPNTTTEPIPTGITSALMGQTEIPNDTLLPAFWDIESWSQKQTIAWSDYLITHTKREHLMGWNIAHDLRGWKVASRYVSYYTEDRLPWSEVKGTVRNLIMYGETFMKSCKDGRLISSPETTQIAIWFTCWENMEVIQQDNMSKASLGKALKAAEGPGRQSFSTFWDALKEIKAHWNVTWEALKKAESIANLSMLTPQTTTDTILDLEGHRELSPPADPLSNRKRTAMAADINDADTNNRRVKKLKKDKAAQRQREDASARMMQHIRNAQNIQIPHHNTNEVVKVYINPGAENQRDLIHVNNNIAVHLKKNQKEGISFLWRECVEAGQGALLAHTMGLGKTLQCITLLSTIAEAASISKYNHLIPQGLRPLKVAIVAPASLTENWRDEIFKWALRKADGTFYMGEIYLIDSDLDSDSRLEHLRSWSTSRHNGILLISYSILDRVTGSKDYSKNEQREVQGIIRNEADIVIADEAQCIKNWKSKAAIALYLFRTARRIAITGSPLNNNLEEYYSIISWACPNFLGPIKEFRSIYVSPITRGLYNDSLDKDYRKALVQLRKLERILQPKVHRAGWEGIPDMPRKTEFMLHLPPTYLQKAVYDTIMDEVNRTPISNPSIVVMSLFNTLRLLAFHPRYFEEKLVLDKAKLIALRQNPTQLLATTGSTEDVTLPDENLEVANENNSQTFLSLDLVQTVLDVYERNRVPETIQRDISHKLSMVIKIIEHSKDEKVLVFSQSLTVLDIIQEELQFREIEHMRIDGQTSNGQRRQQIVKSFNNNPGSAQVMLISTKAGGVGLNLFAASRVIICDQSWNPMNEQQAIGRAYRLGQRNHVFVYRLMMAGSYEEALQNQAIYKEQLASRVVEKKAPDRSASKDFGKFLQPLVPVGQISLTEFRGVDAKVLDKLIDTEQILRIQVGDEFTRERYDPLTAAEEGEVTTYLESRRRGQNGQLAAGDFQGQYEAQLPQVSTSGVGYVQNSGSVGQANIANVYTIAGRVFGTSSVLNPSPDNYEATNLDGFAIGSSKPMQRSEQPQVIDLAGESSSEDDIIMKPLTSVEQAESGLSSLRPLSVSSDGDAEVKTTSHVTSASREAFLEELSQPVSLRRIAQRVYDARNGPRATPRTFGSSFRPSDDVPGPGR